MKKIQSLMALLLCAISFVSCSRKSVVETGLRGSINLIKDEMKLPAELIQGVTWENIAAENKYVVYTYTMEEEGTLIDAMFSPEGLKNNLKMTLMDEEQASFLKMVEAADYGVKWRYSVNGGIPTVIVCENAEIKEWIAESKSFALADYKVWFQQQVEPLAQSCPMQVDEITLMTDCTFDGQDMNYYYEIDETDVSMQMLRDNRSVLEDNIKASLEDEGNPATLILVKNIHKYHVGVNYYYIGATSRDTLLITYNK